MVRVATLVIETALQYLGKQTMITLVIVIEIVLILILAVISRGDIVTGTYDRHGRPVHKASPLVKWIIAIVVLLDTVMLLVSSILAYYLLDYC